MADDDYDLDEEVPVGTFIRRFRVCRTDIDGAPFECVASYDTAADTLAYRRNPDWAYLVYFDDRYLTWPEFEQWARSEKP